MSKLLCGVFMLCCLLPLPLAAQPSTTSAATTTTKPFTRQEDIVYGRSYGTALTLDVFQPTGKRNGAGIIFVVSGGWFSAHELIGAPYFRAFLDPLTERGFTVFAVCHGCQPRYQI